MDYQKALGAGTCRSFFHRRPAHTMPRLGVMLDEVVQRGYVQHCRAPGPVGLHIPVRGGQGCQPMPQPR